jgi:hypothetical protein
MFQIYYGKMWNDLEFEFNEDKVFKNIPKTFRLVFFIV